MNANTIPQTVLQYDILIFTFLSNKKACFGSIDKLCRISLDAAERLNATGSALFAEMGPVVQNIVSLTSSLRGQLVKCFTTSLPNTLIFLLRK